jgi:7-cyano-7-deazaguanine synthase
MFQDKTKWDPPNELSIVLFSGGLDSTVLLSGLLTRVDAHKIIALNFHYGSKHNDKEREAAIAITKMHSVQYVEVNLDFVKELFRSSLLDADVEVPEGHYAAENMKSTVVPFRNGIMLSSAAGLAETMKAPWIYLATHAGDHPIYPDCRPEFTHYMGHAISYGTARNITCIAPFESMTKADIVKYGLQVNAPMRMSWSCYKGGDAPCGKCGTCVERKEAFEANNYPIEK